MFIQDGVKEITNEEKYLLEKWRPQLLNDVPCNTRNIAVFECHACAKGYHNASSQHFNISGVV